MKLFCCAYYVLQNRVLVSRLQKPFAYLNYDYMTILANFMPKNKI